MLYNKFLENVVLPLVDTARGTNYIQELKNWRNNFALLSKEMLLLLQENRLRNLLLHATANVPFYQPFAGQLSGNVYDDIKKLPVIKKNLLKQHKEELLFGDKSKLVSEKSSGSSGEQSEVFMSKKEQSQYQAAQTFLWEWSGYRMGDVMLQTGITPDRGLIKSAKDFLLNTIYVDAYNLSEEAITAKLLQAKKRNCRVFGGYASSLNSFAKAALKNNIQMQFPIVLSWGDKLFDVYRQNISRAFGNPAIHEHYGSTEGLVISGTCEHNRHHILNPHVYLELLDKNGNEVPDGQMGHVVVTRLDAYAFPLIRYYLGDLAIKEPANATCKCGRHFPLLRKIIGRDTDVIQTPGGKDLIVHFFTGIFEHFPTIKQFRVIQKVVGKIEIEYIPDTGFIPANLSGVENMMYKRAQEKIPVQWTKVEVIPATASGKPQIIQNLLVKRDELFK
jgi:phenylacetate-CoA ligase